MELIRYKAKGDTVMGVLIDYNWNLGVYYTIEKLGKMIPEGSYRMQLTHSPKFKKDLYIITLTGTKNTKNTCSKIICQKCTYHIQTLLDSILDKRDIDETLKEIEGDILEEPDADTDTN